MKRSIFHDSGIGKLTLIIFGTLTASIIYSGYCIIPFYYSYYEICNQFEAAIKVASTETDEEIRKKLLYHIKQQQIPVAPEELSIIRSGTRMRIRLPYKEIFYIKFKNKYYDIYTFNFDADVERDF
jgi:hypothetical protein